MIEVKIQNFEGPLDLLLKMIEKQEMDITQVSLARIADQYVEYIRSSKNLIKPGEIGDFLVMAARLLFLKSKVLLPYFEEEEEEEDELTQQLKIYKEFLEASKNIDKIARKKNFMFFPQGIKPQKRAYGSEKSVFNPPRKLKKEDLGKTLQEIIKDIKKNELWEEDLEEDKIDYRVKIEDKINSIRDLVFRKIKFNFDQILENSESKTEIIVSFLAVLELSKQEFLAVDQEDLFSPIFINSNRVKKP